MSLALQMKTKTAAGWTQEVLDVSPDIRVQSVPSIPLVGTENRTQANATYTSRCSLWARMRIQKHPANGRYEDTRRGW